MALIFPLLNKTINDISSPYGYRVHPITGDYKFHSGIDIPATPGTPVYASDSGTIKRVINPLCGNGIILTHGDNTFKTGYCHLDSYTVNNGDNVLKGQQIGTVGNTGASTGPHLHFTVRNYNQNDGPSSDPYLYNPAKINYEPFFGTPILPDLVVTPNYTPPKNKFKKLIYIGIPILLGFTLIALWTNEKNKT